MVVVHAVAVEPSHDRVIHRQPDHTAHGQKRASSRSTISPEDTTSRSYRQPILPLSARVAYSIRCSARRDHAVLAGHRANPLTGQLARRASLRGDGWYLAAFRSAARQQSMFDLDTARCDTGQRGLTMRRFPGSGDQSTAI